MSKRYKADWKIVVSVEFEDDGKNDLNDQAYDAVRELLGAQGGDFDGEQVGDVQEIEQ